MAVFHRSNTMSTVAMPDYEASSMTDNLEARNEELEVQNEELRQRVIELEQLVRNDTAREDTVCERHGLWTNRCCHFVMGVDFFFFNHSARAIVSDGGVPVREPMAASGRGE